MCIIVRDNEIINWYIQYHVQIISIDRAIRDSFSYDDRAAYLCVYLFF